MLIDQLNPLGIVVMISGGFSIIALLISQISNLLKKKQNIHSGSYECGFSNYSDEFLYTSEVNGAISLYLVIELAIIWLLICCSLHVLDDSFNEPIFLRILSLIILMSIAIAYQTIFKNDKSNA